MSLGFITWWFSVEISWWGDLLRMLSTLLDEEKSAEARPEELPNPLVEATERGEALAANPMVQKIMKSLSDAGI